VHEDIYDEFIKKSIERAQNRKVGDPFTENVEQGPQVCDAVFSQQIMIIKLEH